MRRFLIFFILPLLFLAACRDTDEPASGDNYSEKTVFMYMPWSTNLTSYFYQNINDMEASIEEMGGLLDERVVVFISNSPTEASLFEIKWEDGKCNRADLKSYSCQEFTTQEGIAEILEDVFFYAPAKKYSMIIGCHGMGWLPVGAGRAKRSPEMHHWDCTPEPLTRFFGGMTQEYQTDISTLSAAIAGTGHKMEYILFDDCYMANIEVAYELKDVADYLIASTCEVMAYGMPYATMGKHLLGIPDYKAVCDDFHEFYSAYSVPCGTLSVTDLSKIEEMASLMQQINNRYNFDEVGLDKLQKLDGYTPTIFYDFGDYIRLLLEQNDEQSGLMEEFETLLNQLVPYKTNTDKFYTAKKGPLKINRYSGLTTSDPSVNDSATDKAKTKWHIATH